MTSNFDTEDQIILGVLRALEPKDDPVGEGVDDPLGRVYIELAGLIPCAVEPVIPDPAVKERLMAAITGGVVREAGRPLPADPPRLTEHPRFRQRASRRGPVAANDNRRLRTFLAAAAVVLMVGAGGWFYLQLERQRTTVATLQDELQATSRDLATAHQRIEEVSGDTSEVLAALRGMTLLTAASIEVCPLHPPGESSPQPDARGNLLVAMESGQWSLRVNGLEAAASGQVYVLWFFDQERPFKKVNLGTGGRLVEVNARGVPALMTSVSITLEESPETEAPTGPPLLYGHRREMYQL